MAQNYQNIIIGFGKAGRALAKSLAIHGETTIINIESLTNGMYFLRIADKTVKIIKN